MDIFSSRYFEFLRLVHETEPECQQFPDIFFPDDWELEEHKAKKLAKEFCDRCPIKSQCIEYAVAANELYGIWGGTTPRERRYLRKGN
jgi:WhiB family redox-sensing transcriptional regulator